jgi:hypothetical protein
MRCKEVSTILSNCYHILPDTLHLPSRAESFKEKQKTFFHCTFLLTRYSLDVEKRLRFVNLNVTDGAEAVFFQILDEAAATNWKTKEKANIRQVNKLTG